MSSEQIDALARYAKAFEEAFSSDDWSVVGACMTDGVEWVSSGVEPPYGDMVRGRDAALAAAARSCNHLDRRFDTRKPELTDGPTPFPGGVHLAWRVVYAREGLPDMALLGEEWDFFDDGLLAFHRERIWNAEEVIAFIAEHEATLRPVGGS